MRIQDYMKLGQSAHLVGIGGVSMAPLAEVLHAEGLVVTGSDMRRSETVQNLEALGIKVTIGHLPEAVNGAGCIIRTAAVHDDNPEIAAAHAAGIPVFERAEAWGAIMRRYKNALCVSGTHGKTTTTSMCTHIFLAAKKDPTVMIGGTLPVIGSGHRSGGGDTIILEACEYCNSFLSFAPTVAVILNVEADHLDFFQDLNDVQKSFHAFAALVPERGCVVANCEDANTMQALEGIEQRVLTFGIDKGDVCAGNLLYRGEVSEFDIMLRGAAFCHVQLHVPGAHNVKNALAAAAAAIALGISPTAVADGLAAFSGVGRRFEYKGNYHGAKIYDDYAHHPSELEALLTAAKSLGYRRVICAFQPHTYTRTQEFLSEFAQTLALADQVVLAEIYAAREENESGISSKDLADRLPGSVFFETLGGVESYLRETAAEGDLILTVGAGDIYLVGESLVK